MMILWPFLCGLICGFRITFSLEDPLAAKFQPPGKANQVFGKKKSWLLGKVHDAVDLNKGPRTSGSKIAL